MYLHIVRKKKVVEQKSASKCFAFYYSAVNIDTETFLHDRMLVNFYLEKDYRALQWSCLNAMFSSSYQVIPMKREKPSESSVQPRPDKLCSSSP